MELLYHRCAALDVHKASVVACRVRTLPNGQKEQDLRWEEKSHRVIVRHAFSIFNEIRRCDDPTFCQ